MAGINPNLGNNLKLQQTQQLKATVNVDTQQSSGNEVGEAKKSAVWIPADQREKKGFPKADYRVGDVISDFKTDQHQKIVGIKSDGTLVLEVCTRQDHLEAIESDRGDFRI